MALAFQLWWNFENFKDFASKKEKENVMYPPID